MSVIPDFQNTVMTIVVVVLLVATVVALVDALARKAEAFEAAGKLTKKGWVLILAVMVGMELLLGGIGMFAGAIATIVYFVDVRPAVAAMTPRR